MIPAGAWKPYTHTFTGDNARADAVDNGSVTILGREYAVPARLVQALSQKRAWYDAGVVGPDAFPDLVMGQSVIHPKDTGQWLDHVLGSAWAAQGSPTYTDDEQLEILAFAYGFLTHAAGDMWSHTLVNDFSGGVFPAVSEIFSDPAQAVIAVKHIIVEGYIGDATPGFDGNPDRNVAPGLNEDGNPDISDDSTRGIAYAAPPDKFIYDVFVARGVDAAGHYTQKLPGQPTADRGPLIDFFYNLRNSLSDEAGTNSNIQQIIDDFNDLKEAIADVEFECSFPPDLIECPIALGVLGFETFDAFTSGIANLVEAAIEAAIDAYLAAWVDDIDSGLEHWGQIGLAMAQGLFDPQTRRNEQNEACGQVGSGELDPARANCEDGVGMFDTLLERLGPHFTTSEPHLLSMLGAPDFVGAVIELIDEISDFIDDLIDFPNPLETALAELEEFLKDKLNEAVEEVFGFNPETFSELLKNPASYLDPVHPPLNLPAPLDGLDQVGGLFGAGEHGRLDAIIGFDQPGLTSQHHDVGSRRLLDQAEFLINEFAPLENTIVTAKLLLLDGPELNRALGDILGRTVNTYGPGQNLMVDSFDSNPSDAVVPPPWLRSIDSDHAWRFNGAPVFASRDVALNGGNGTLPLFESCVLRPTFRALFTDWENASNPEGNDFPDLGDTVSTDPINDPNPPTPSSTQTGGASFTHPDGRHFVGGNNVFTLDAVDTPTGQGFPAGQFDVRYRVYTDPLNPGPWVDANLGETFTITGGDGRHFIDVQAADPCHTFADDDGGDPADPLAPSAVVTTEVWLDTTPPVVTGATPPFGLTFDTDDFTTVDFSVDDGVNGSGVASHSATIDGWDGDPNVPNKTRATFDGDVLDLFLFYPGTRTVAVTAADNIGNGGTTPLTFKLQATAESLLSNLERAHAEGKVGNVFNSLRVKLVNADKKHDDGRHDVEANMLGAFINELEAQRGKKVDTRIANRFIAFAQDLIDAGG
ncbi:MAG: hypothetical protein ABR540_00490 [Acidimicrobiales bacterium]